MMNELDDYIFNTHPLFDHEFNKIIRKHQCPSLEKDFERLKMALVQELKDHNKFHDKLCNKISGFDKNVKNPAFIVKSFRCKAINKGSRSGFRIVFYFLENIIPFILLKYFIKIKKKLRIKKELISYLRNKNPLTFYFSYINSS